MPHRCIRLRRPVTLVRMEGPFVPERSDLDEVERRWRALCRRNPAYFDGRILHVAGVHRNGCGGATLHVIDCAYRFHAVQDEHHDLGVRPLGVKGLTRRGDRLLLGRRSPSVASYGGLWEFAPGGGVEPGVDPGDALLTELREETGLGAAGEPRQEALLFDDVLRTWELVFALAADDAPLRPRRTEYDELAWCSGDELPTALSPVARAMVALIH